MIKRTNEEYPQLRDNMSTMTREIWKDADTLLFSKTAESRVPPTLRPDYSLLMRLPFGVFAPPHALPLKPRGCNESDQT